MAYVQALDGHASFEGRSSFKTWLFGVIRRIAAGERRRSWLTASHLARFARLTVTPEITGNPEAETLTRGETARLLQALDRLSARQREILHLVFYQDLTLEQAAGVLGTRLGTARVHYERGKRRLRALLAREETR